MRKAAFWIFLSILAVAIVAPLAFVQSETFARMLTKFAREELLGKLGIEGEFSGLSVKLFPPGVEIKAPSVSLKERNALDLPAGTKVEAKKIEVTFELFQLATGTININGVLIQGASLKLDLPHEYFKNQEKQKKSEFLKDRKWLSWENLFRFRIRSVGLTESNVDVKIGLSEKGAPLAIKTYARELTVGKGTLEGTPSYDFAFDFGQTQFSGYGIEQNFSQMQASMSVSSKSISLKSLGLQDGKRSFYADGRLNGNLLDPKTMPTDVHFIVRGPLEEWVKDKNLSKNVPVVKDFSGKGDLKVEGHAKADLVSLGPTLRAEATLGLKDASIVGWDSEQIDFKGSWDGTHSTIESGEIRLGSGKISLGKFTFDPLAENFELPMKVDLSDADFHRLLGPAVDKVYGLHMKISGSIDAKAVVRKNSKTDPFKITAETALSVRDFSFDNEKRVMKKQKKTLLAVPHVAVKAGIEVSEAGVKITHADAVLPNTALKATGSITAEHGIDLDIHGDIDASDVGKLSVFDIEGKGPLHWTVKGKSPAIFFTFDADLKNAKYLNLHLGDVKGRVVWDDDKEILSFHDFKAEQGRLQLHAVGAINLGDNNDDINMRINVPRGTIQDFSKVFAEFINKSISWYPWDLTGQMTGDLVVSGKTDIDKLSVLGNMKIENAEWHYENFAEATMYAGFDKGAFIARNIAIRKKNAWIKGDIEYSASDELNFNLHSEGLSSYDIDRFALLEIPWRAPISFTAQGQGKIGILKSTSHLQVGAGTVKNYPIPSSDIRMTTENARLVAHADLFGSRGILDIDYGWNDGAASTIRGEGRSFDLLPALVALNPELTDEQNLSTDITGSADLKFKTGKLSRANGHIDIDAFSLRRSSASLHLEKPVHLAVHDGAYDLGRIAFKGQDTSILISGNSNGAEVHQDLSGQVNLKLLELFVPEISGIAGEADLKGTIRGRADAPDVRMDVAVTDASLRLRSFSQGFDGFRCQLHVEDSVIKANDIYARFAGGKVYGSGHVDLWASKAPDLDFHFQLENPKVQVYPVAYARVNGKLAVKGTQLPYKVKGSFAIGDALIKENFGSEGSKALKSSKFLPGGSGGSSGELQLFDLDIDLSAENSILVKNDLFDAELRGNLKIINSPKSPRILGKVDVIHGKMFFKDNYFTMTNASLHFDNPTALDPAFNMAGQVEMKGYKIFLTANGKTSDYQLNLQSQPPLSQNDIVNLLTLGVTSSGYQDLSRADRDAYTKDEMYGLLFNQSSINKGLQDKLGLKLRLDQSQNNTPESVFRAQSGDTSANVSPKVVVQKEITKNLNLKAGATVGGGENSQKDVNLEYELGRKWSLMGVYEDQRGAQPQNSRTSLGADVKFKVKFK